MTQDDIPNKKNKPRKFSGSPTATSDNDVNKKPTARVLTQTSQNNAGNTQSLQPSGVTDKTRIQLRVNQLSTKDDAKSSGRDDATRHHTPDNQTRLKPISSDNANPFTVKNDKNDCLPSLGQTSSPRAAHLILKHRFVLEKTVGIGGMGVVYKAKDLRKVEAKDRNPYVAVKILNEDFRHYPDAFIALQREARKSQSIAHPNIVNVHDFDRDGDTVFMTMEFMEGRPLDKLIQLNRSAGLMYSQAMDILRGMCAALDHAHGENIIHSDFKPGNVFITKSGATKVFDFGIARAVANTDKYGNDQDNTEFNVKALSQSDKTVLHNDKSLFDPDTFGALTPAYASLEMLQGQSPSRQDDIYALAVVTYEMLSGMHPFQRLNAEEAMARKLKPKRIKSISRQQWQALRKGLAFKREHRTLTVREFLLDLTQIKKSVWKKPMAFVAVLAIGIGVYVESFEQKEPSPGVTRVELERQIKADISKETIESIIREARFTESWHAALWKEIQNARKLLGNQDQWLITTESAIMEKYVRRAKVKRLAKKLTDAQTLMSYAKKYRGNAKVLEAEQIQLGAALEQYRIEKRVAQKKQDRAREAERQLIAEQQAERRRKEQAKIDTKRPAPTKTPPSEVELPSKDVFALALINVKQQLRCKNDLNTRNFNAAIQKLKSIDASRYKYELPRLVGALAVCIEKVGANDSNRAEDLKTFALTLFPGNLVIAKIKIAPKDPCNKNKAGLGARGKKGTCRDRLLNGGYGPRLVVVPPTAGVKAFSIGQFEISIEQINDYCSRSQKCKKRTATDTALPITNISVDIARSYATWLSRMTGYTYRIPRKKEWLHAAGAVQSELDDNRNCTVNSRGINKGEHLEAITAGQKNDWGLVNHVGNAQEWVLVNNRKLVAMGGAHTDPIQQCQLTSQRSHSGKPDKITGFRLVREIK
ncbi:MAG: protein kinase [Gammaproteobacteria bacterium]|nr:protein kinase [Gammaproteobacteria bacterium]